MYTLLHSTTLDKKIDIYFLPLIFPSSLFAWIFAYTF